MTFVYFTLSRPPRREKMTNIYQILLCTSIIGVRIIYMIDCAQVHCTCTLEYKTPRLVFVRDLSACFRSILREGVLRYNIMCVCAEAQQFLFCECGLPLAEAIAIACITRANKRTLEADYSVRGSARIRSNRGFCKQYTWHMSVLECMWRNIFLLALYEERSPILCSI